MKQRIKENLVGYTFSAPFFIGMVVFVLLPAVLSLYYSFTDFAMIAPPEFIGFGNYSKMAADEIYKSGLKNTLYFAALFAPGMTIVSLIFAIFLNMAVNFFKGKSLIVIRAIYYFPAVAPWAVIGTIWMWFLNKDVGVINNVIAFLGFERISFLSANSPYFIPATVVAGIWKGLGYMMFIYLIGLQNIPKHYYEAAEVDGASWWYKVRRITIPLVTPTIFFVSIISTLWAFNTFEQFYVMGATIEADDLEKLNVLYYMYQLGFQYFKMGYASSIAWVLFIITGSITLIQNKLQKYWVNY